MLPPRSNALALGVSRLTLAPALSFDPLPFGFDMLAFFVSPPARFFVRPQTFLCGTLHGFSLTLSFFRALRLFEFEPAFGFGQTLSRSLPRGFGQTLSFDLPASFSLPFGLGLPLGFDSTRVFFLPALTLDLLLESFV